MMSTASQAMVDGFEKQGGVRRLQINEDLSSPALFNINKASNTNNDFSDYFNHNFVSTTHKNMHSPKRGFSNLNRALLSRNHKSGFNSRGSTRLEPLPKGAGLSPKFQPRKAGNSTTKNAKQ